MTNLDFGKQLRNYRRQCENTQTRKPLTQQQVADFLYEEIGIDYTGAAVSDWELNKSKIGVNDRLVLTSLIKILKRHGGIKTLADANLLLEAGDYRALNINERDEVFPRERQEAILQSSTFVPKEQTRDLKFPWNDVLSYFPEEFQKIVNEAKEGPPPAWPRIAVAITNKATSKWTIFNVLKILVWVWIWWLTYVLITPSLYWPWTTEEDAIQALVLYASGTLILPLFIGALVNTKDQSFWVEQKISNALITRLYVYQGAYIGFHLGYFFIFPLALIQEQLKFQPILWLELVKVIIPIAIGYAGAQLVPYNLWRAYNRLHIKDGNIFFIFVILGPLWACFLFEFHKTIEIVTLLIAVTLLTVAMAVQYRRKGNTIIPLLWVVIFYGLIMVCQIASLLIQ